MLKKYTRFVQKYFT